MSRRVRTDRGKRLYRAALVCALLVLPFTLSCRRDDPEAAFLQAQALLDAGDYEAARSAFFALPEDPRTLNALLACSYAEGEALFAMGDYQSARNAFTAAAGYRDAAARIEAAWFAQAEDLFAAGRYEEARTAYANAPGQAGSAERLLAADYALAKLMLESGDYEAAAEAFGALGDYADSAACAAQAYYLKAERILASGDPEGAAALFEATGAYLDAPARAEQIRASLAWRAQSMLTVGAGDRVVWGAYEQDNDQRNGPEPLEWRILAVEGDTLLLISEYVLDSLKFNDQSGDPHNPTRWDTCSLRAWLNGAFLETAFSEAERGAIALSHLTNEDNPVYQIEGCADTDDRVFVLSLAEAQTLFADDGDRIGLNTPYATARGAFTDDNGAGWWWLRTVGYTNIFNTIVLTDGEASAYGTYYGYGHRAVRPSLRLDRTAGVFAGLISPAGD